MKINPLHQIKTIPLDIALSEKQLNIEGKFIGVLESTDIDTYIQIKFNTTDSENIRFKKGLYLTQSFDKIFLTCAAQAGKSVDLIIASDYGPEIFELFDERAVELQTAELTAIKNNIRSLNGDTETRVNKSVDGAGAATTIVHTVTAGKNFYLTSFSVQNYGSSPYLSDLKVRNASDVVQYSLIRSVNGSLNNSSPATRCLPSPIKIPAGWDIVIYSPNSSSTTYVDLNGFEETA